MCAQQSSDNGLINVRHLQNNSFYSSKGEPADF